MAQIVINEISQNYTYNIGNNTFATVALPITASWGPCVQDKDSIPWDEALDNAYWSRFPATQEGLESFVATYRGPATISKSINDYSYQQAMTLLTSGYDVLVCRLCPGNVADSYFIAKKTTPATGEDPTVTNVAVLKISAKYPGSFGNNIGVTIKAMTTYSLSQAKTIPCWNIIVYSIDEYGATTPLENLMFTFVDSDASDSLLYVDEVESNYISIDATNILDNWATLTQTGTTWKFEGDVDTTTTPAHTGFYIPSTDKTSIAIRLGKEFTIPTIGGVSYSVTEGTDYMEASTTGATNITNINTYVKDRYDDAHGENSNTSYAARVATYITAHSTGSIATRVLYQQWLFTYAYHVYDLLGDRLAYNPQRIISPGWDDQNVLDYGDLTDYTWVVSPLHVKIVEMSNKSRCAAGLIDIPKGLPKSDVYTKDGADGEPIEGYAQKLSNLNPLNLLYSTHSALICPWGQYQYVGTSRQAVASPSFLFLLLQRAMLLNQAVQYEWALPTNRKTNLKIGKLDWDIGKKYLDMWQKIDGVGVNCITNIPDLGLTIWGNSTLFNTPPATYNALQNLSTRYLMNALEDLAYRCGIGITFQYNNDQAYDAFYAGMTPLLDTMKNVGAIDDYYITMAADINGLDQVNANTVIGKVYLVINGVINDIKIDLIALPPQTDLSQFGA